MRPPRRKARRAWAGSLALPTITRISTRSRSTDTKAPNVGDQYIRSSIWQLFAGYNFSDRLGLQFNLPIIYQEYGYQSEHGSESGIGDASLIGNVRLLQELSVDSTLVWTALGGVKFPTGDASRLNPNEPDFAPGIGGHDLALGSGSFDGLVGTGFFARWKRLFVTGGMQYAVRSEGDFAYQFANDWTWSGGPGGYLILGDRYTLSLQLVVSGETKGEDTIAGVATDDTAITAVYLGPQLNLTWTGQQVVPDYRVRAGVTWHF